MENSNQEIWRVIKGTDNKYQVSDQGRVMNTNGKVLKQTLSNNGYYVVTLFLNKQSKSKTVHSLVAETFLNYVPNKGVICVDHINNNPLDNRVENLQLLSYRENCTKDKLKLKGKTSKYVGVSFASKTKKWIASIRFDGAKLGLGSFAAEQTAAKVYQLALSIINNDLLTDKLTAINNLKAEYKESKKKENITKREGKRGTTYRVAFKNKYVGTFKTLEEAKAALGVAELRAEILGL